MTASTPYHGTPRGALSGRTVLGYYSDRRLSPVSGPTADAGLAAKLWGAGAAAVGDTAH